MLPLYHTKMMHLHLTVIFQSLLVVTIHLMKVRVPLVMTGAMKMTSSVVICVFVEPLVEHTKEIVPWAQGVVFQQKYTVLILDLANLILCGEQLASLSQTWAHWARGRARRLISIHSKRNKLLPHLRLVTMSACTAVDWLVGMYPVVLSENVGRGTSYTAGWASSTEYILVENWLVWVMIVLLHLMAGVKHPQSLSKV